MKSDNAAINCTQAILSRISFEDASCDNRSISESRVAKPSENFCLQHL